MIARTQEIILEDDSLCAVVRPRIAAPDIYRVERNGLAFRRMTVRELLEVRDRLAGVHSADPNSVLEIDFHSFHDYTPIMRDARTIGYGAQFLNRYLSSKLFADYEAWQDSLFRFLSLHSYAGRQLLIGERIPDRTTLLYAVDRAIAYLQNTRPTEPYETVRFALQNFGFEPGWGNNAARILETLGMLESLVTSQDHAVLEQFLTRIPMIFRVVLVSQHGWFAQEGVIGRPDSGGQIVYVLNQARALAAHMKEDAHLAGLDTLGVEPRVVVLTRLIPQADGTSVNQRLERFTAATTPGSCACPSETSARA